MPLEQEHYYVVLDLIIMIGKLKKPEYYAENQQGENKHDSITPNMSAKILKQHVADGLELADEYGLPSIVKDFIATHHGTKRMEYFYQKALNEFPDQRQCR